MKRYLEVVAPYLDSVLVDDLAWARLRAVAALLPPCSLAGLELRVREGRTPVDFFVRLPYADPELSPWLLRHPVWRAVQGMADAISNPSSRLHDQVRRLFLEFDLDQTPSEVPIPALFLVLNTDRAFTAEELLAAVDALGIHPRASAGGKEALDCCLAALPPGAAPAHLGVMLSRPGGALRVVIHGMPLEATPSYLESIGWQDPDQQLVSLIRDMSALSDPVALLNLDVSGRLCPKVGVEFYVRGDAEHLPRWTALLAFLVDRKLASPAKAKALLSWPGFTEAGGGDRTWPENLAMGDLLFRAQATSLFWRTINHVKLGYEPGHAPEVKAYLGFGHNWFPTRAAASG